MNTKQQALLNELIAKYGNDSQQIQAVTAGFVLYETHKDNLDFKHMLELDKEATLLHHQAITLIYNIENTLKKKLQQGDATEIEKKNLKNAMSDHEDRIFKYKSLLSETVKKLTPLAQHFGYPVFNKQINYTI